MASATAPPIPYFGSKARLAERIVGLLPKRRVYLEPFFGSGAVLFAKRPSAHEIVNDRDGAVVNFFRVLRDRHEELEAACVLSPYARDEFDAADLADPDADSVERARRLWVRVNQSFSKSGGGATGWSLSVSRTQSTAASALSRVGRFADAAARLAGVAIENADAVELIARVADATTVIYADPPYLAATRAGGRDLRSDYRCEFSSEDDHRRLAEALHATEARVVLSGRPSGLYDELYAGWWSGPAGPAGQAAETLWANFEPVDPQPVLAFDAPAGERPAPP